MPPDQKSLKDAGLKVTGPRLKIIEVLANSKHRHFSAENIYRELLHMGDEVPLATIYRALTDFEAAGIVQKQNFEGDRSIFELNEGPHHDHLVCVTCHKIEEFVDNMIEERQREIAERMGYQMKDHSLTIYGICQSCQGAKSANMT